MLTLTDVLCKNIAMGEHHLESSDVPLGDIFQIPITHLFVGLVALFAEGVSSSNFHNIFLLG